MIQISPYLNRIIERYPPLDIKDQIRLLKEAQNGDEQAREDFILSNLRLVRTVAQQLGVPQHWDMDDLISEGVQGLSDSIDKFDVTKGTKPSTFFWKAIKWKILKFKKSVGEPHLSLNEKYETEDEREFEYLDRIEDRNANNLIKEMESKADLQRLLQYIPEHKQIIIILRYGLFGFDQYSLDDIGLAVNRTHAGVNYAVSRAIEKMQEFPDVDPWYNLISKQRVQEIIDKADILSKSEKVLNREKKEKGKKKVDSNVVQHNYHFKSGSIASEFQKEFGEQIRKDYEIGGSLRNLAIKYNCPKSQISKAVNNGTEIEEIKKSRRESKVCDKIEHNYVFKKGWTAPEFQEEFGDQIRKDYTTGRSVNNLATKYNCPRSQIKRAIKDGQEKVD